MNTLVTNSNAAVQEGNGHAEVAAPIPFPMEPRRLEEALRDSERRFREMIDALPAAIYTTDAEGRLTHFNAAAVEFSGRVPELGTDQWCVSWKLYNPDGTPLPHDQCPMAIALKERRAIRGAEAIAERPDGKRIWFMPYPTPLFDRDGKLTGGINMLVDITERKEAEQARARLASIVENSDDAILSKDLYGTIKSWNRGAEQLFGYTAEEMVGQSIFRLIPPELRAEEDRILASLRAGLRIDHYETVRVSKDGRLIDVSLTISPLKDGSGRIVGASKIVHDITERRTSERALKEAHEQLRRYADELETRVAARTADLRETNEQLEAFVYSIAHDLRAPLRSMTGFSQLLVDDYSSQLEEPARQMLKRIHASSEFMDKLLFDLLAYGRAARAQLELGPVSVEKAWHSARFQCALQIEETGATIEVTRPLPTVRAHEATLSQCLANLLSNALKFVAPDVKPCVRLVAEDCGASVRLWVHDNGIGIPPDQHERIFRVFERLHGSLYSGTGIGLSIVRKGVQRMGGELGLQSKPPAGSAFWIELPKA